MPFARPVGLLLCAVVAGTSCSDDSPSPLAPTGTVVVSGVISELAPGGVRTVEGAYLWGYIEEHGLRSLLKEVRADASGRYQLELPRGGVLRLQVWKEGYFQQCAAPAVTLAGNRSIDLQLVPASSVSSSPSSVPSAVAGFRTISGTVYETTGTGRQPVSGADIVYDRYNDFWFAETLTDASGHFLLCGIPDGQHANIEVLGRRGLGPISVPPGQTSGVEIVVP